jgi:hypothetical protein
VTVPIPRRGFIVNDCIQELADQLKSIEGLRSLDYEADDPQVPAAIVGLPRAINYMLVTNPRALSLQLQITILVGLVDDRRSRSAATSYADTVGDKSVKWVVERGRYTAMDTVAVKSSRFTVLQVAKVKYLAVVFDVDIVGRAS